MSKTLASAILLDDLRDFERKTIKKELSSVLNVYAMELLQSENLVCLKYIARYIPLKNFRDAHQRTLLHYAATININACDYLIQKGLDVHALDDERNTPLDIAILHENGECAERLKNIMLLEK